MLAVVLLAAGALLATVARPSREVSATAAATPSAAAAVPLVVTDASLLAGLDGTVRVRASGSGPVLVAVGTAADVAAWAQGAATTTLTRSGDDGSLTPTTSEGEAEVPDPAGSDLWTAQATGTGSAELTTEPTTGPGAGSAPLSVLVASDGTAATPTDVELVWSEHPVPLLAWALLGAGALVGLLALRGVGGRARREAVVVTLPQTRPATGPVPDLEPAPAPATAPAPEAPADGATEPVLLRRPRGSDRRRDRRSLR
ncbi:hypothetical protein [Quadrisphaera sp. INWT6]|uniref:hypothetical protein n=1 Tax=Quadrisphaera sp. INWT6 TaxID=2596917 RepID=UPI00189223DB|nr:hypothetical protein [Quadrisphaera sp. INWT6]MBF5080584.1 hypothetical protein [Quadrisphaera sp. INWT6]